MGLLDGVLNTISGGSTGLVSSVMGLVKDYFPPDMTDAQKAELTQKANELALAQEKQAADALKEAETALTDRISKLEGTASDLLALPVVGRVILFLRGAQRPIWGYATMYCDFMWFSGQWPAMTDQQQSCLWVVNLLVLGFLFGERAVKNVTPLIAQYFGKGK